MVVSSPSMKVGMITATATIQGLIAGRLIAGAESATVLMKLTPPRAIHAPRRAGSVSDRRMPRSRSRIRRELRQWVSRLQDVPGVRPFGRFLVVHVGRDRQADKQGGVFVRVVVRQFDADRQSLDDLHEVAGGVL